MQVKIILCGGAGTNIGGMMEQYHWDRKEVGMCQLIPLVVDTADSNISKIQGIPEQNIHLLQGVKKGSGKIRTTNIQAIRDQVPNLMTNPVFAPGDFTIVVHSAGGGSGSAIGPTVVNELVRLNKPFVVIAIGSYNSKTEAQNTQNVLLGYENVSRKTNHPVVCIYRENNEDTPRSIVDEQVMTAITGLSILFSGDNEELDPEDISNFLKYTNATPYPSALTMMDIFHPVVEVAPGQLVQSVITLSNTHDDAAIGVPVRYRSNGVVPTSRSASIINDQMFPMHFATVGGFFTPVLDRLNEVIKGFDEYDRVNKVKQIDLGNVDSDDDGLVL